MLRLAIGGVFIYAGWAKRNEGIEFADSVASFRILPSVVIVPFMLSIVPFEIGAGAMVLTGWQKRVGALGLLLMASLYSIALALALARGITVNCGCFGTSAVGANPWVDLGRDLLLAAGCGVLYRIATRSVGPKPAL
jgi:putative oxidoreductase